MRTVLPEKWCINREPHSKVQKWFTKTADNGKDYSDRLLGWYSHFPAIGSMSYTNNLINLGYEEITIEEFKTLVLKENLTYEIF